VLFSHDGPFSACSFVFWRASAAQGYVAIFDFHLCDLVRIEQQVGVFHRRRRDAHHAEKREHLNQGRFHQ
jgi:hypothetical protein